ncbi:uncharacterized protein BJ171DRAFT_489578 [Polychytrium aggregatum]|uniref:uncharacterized protein n=1 Tax=Polychytrium aggregatum TaxID=110093 RepID=UPI0022FE707A|nr:uncharacterized protein BJ171DRAFT_489578 [Polychytrium aggregatum]KAI9208647.1 hypothetical protein BJ171DRAFT_489578 [Polychytrium aggregatum]
MHRLSRLRPCGAVRCLSTSTLARSSSSASAVSPGIFSSPRPIPLGNKQDQEEFERLLKQADSQISSDVAAGIQHPDAQQHKLEGWEGNKNPQTGEIGGPKGAEPTRFGDWERKGRVYDF